MDTFVTHILEHYGLQAEHIVPFTNGLINTSFLVQVDADRYVLQRLAPVFSPEVNCDMAVVTEHLRSRGMPTPLLIPSQEGKLWAQDADGAMWRLMNYVDGTSFDRPDTTERCAAAADLLGRFHTALWDLNYEYQHTRLGVHDTTRHVALLEDALEIHGEHELIAEVRPLAEEIVSLRGTFVDLDGLPRRHVHGDPKLNNIIFDQDGAGICFVDLDTLAKMPLAVELGDALRSWCNPGGEDSHAACFELEYFEAAMTAYRRRMATLASPMELAPIPDCMHTITIELAARFCRDILEERYFGWDHRVYPRAGAHHLTRTRAMLQLARSQREELGITY